MIHHAIQKGIDEGFILACARSCDGGDDPQERCPMEPKDGCACLYAEWIKLPWWRKMWRDEPQKPSRKATLTALFRNRLAEEVRVAAEKRMCRP